MTDEIEERVRGVLVDVFGLDASEVGPDTSTDTVEAWDSLQQLSVVLALEEELEVSFTDEETMEMVSFPLIVATVREKLGIADPA
jgi:acyl carrier protein